MKTRVKNITCVISISALSLLLNACATSYTSIQPQKISYHNNSQTRTNDVDDTQQVFLSYQYDVLRKRYQKKEWNKGLRVVAVKIDNRSGEDLVMGKDLHIKDDKGKEMYLFDDYTIFKTLRQRSASHLCYLLLSVVNLQITTTNNSAYRSSTQTKNIPVGLVLGPALAIGNVAYAGNANSYFKEDIKQYNLAGKTIPKGKIVYGIIAVQTYNNPALSLHYGQE